jgi:hypothetical protein
MIENFRFFLKFKTYNPDIFNIVDEKLHEIFSVSSNQITKENPFLKVFGARIEKLQLSKGPIALPRKKKLFTVNRSHHVHKKSQEQFVQITYNRFWVLDLSLNLTATSDPTNSEKWKKLQISSFDPKASTGKNKKVIKTLFIPWFYEETDLLNIVNFIKFSLEPLEKLPGLSMHWKASRLLKKILWLCSKGHSFHLGVIGTFVPMYLR